MKHFALLGCFGLGLGLAACASSDDDDLPVQPSGGFTSAAGNVTALHGSVCVLVDPRFLDACTATGAGGLTVITSNGNQTTTAADGTFAVPRPTSMSNMSLTVTGPAITSSTVIANGNPVIPIINSELFAQMLAANGVRIGDGLGSIITTVAAQSGEPVAGVTATSTPAGVFGPLFDGSSATAFTLNETGERGVTWFAGVPAGPADLTFVGPSGTESTVDGVQVFDGGISFLETILP